RDLRPDVPAAIERLVTRMLSKDPAGRPADAAAVAEALSNVDEDARELPAVDTASARALTNSEQSLVSVIVIRPAPYAGDQAVTRTLTPAEVNASWERLLAAAAHFSARIEPLRDGSAIAAVAGKSSAKDQAAHAARCALAMRAAWPGSLV